MIDFLRTALRSFINNYRATMWRLHESSLTNEQLGLTVGMSPNAVRNRRTKPDLWKLSDVEQLASYFSLSTTACNRLRQVLLELSSHVEQLPGKERRQMETLLATNVNQLNLFNKNDWPVRDLLRIHDVLLTN